MHSSAPLPPLHRHAAAPAADDPPGMEHLHFAEADTDPLFVRHVRTALRAEAAESPVAAALLACVAALPGRITLRRRRAGLARTTTDADGHTTIRINPQLMTPATLAHEFAHAIQQGVSHHALHAAARRTGRAPAAAEVAAAIEAGRAALDRVVPVRNDDDCGHDHKENEAMRVSNIVNAERTASQMRALPPALRTYAEYHRRLRRLESAPRHQDNEAPLPPGSMYGRHDFHHVRQILAPGRPPQP